MRKWFFRIIKALSGSILAISMAVVVYAYFTVPPAKLRKLSGPPPLFISSVDMGTAFFIDSRGYLLTNRHVVRNCRTITVSGHGFQAERASIVSVPSDPGVDLALLKGEVSSPAWLGFEDGFWLHFRSVGSADTVRIAFQKIDESIVQEARIIGFPGRNHGSVPTSEAVRVPGDVNSSDLRHWYPLVDGEIMQGSSGSPVLDGSGHVLGVLFRLISNVGRGGRTEMIDSSDGMSARHGLFIPGSVAAPFAYGNGATFSESGSGQPAMALARVFCFHGWP